MARLLQIFGFLSVLLRGATLTSQSLTIGGIVFLVFVARPTGMPADQLQQAALRWIRRAAAALARWVSSRR
jgi:putative copper resistance protein D